VGQLRYQASSFYNVVLFNNEKALSWDFSATCFTLIMVVTWVVISQRERVHCYNIIMCNMKQKLINCNVTCMINAKLKYNTL
jgi:hypothetical protein